MNYTVIFDIRNDKNDYVVCTEKIEKLISNKYDLKKGDFKIVKPVNSTMPANKLEEPLNGIDFSSSFQIIKLQEYLKDTAPNLKFHIRIHFSDDLNLEEFHYLALMMGKLNGLVKNRKLSFFLVPRTSDVYPYEKNGAVDTELFNVASMYLRTIIEEGKKGIIYGVPVPKLENDNIVKALDFKVIFKATKFFPLIFFDGNIEYDKNNEDKYLKAEKVGNAVIHNNSVNFNSINNYSLLFKNGVIWRYVDWAKQLKKRQRFGFSTHGNSIIAFCDYIFETAYHMLNSKAISAGLSTQEIVSILSAEFKNCNVFSFAIFSFILNITENLSENDLKTTLKNSYQLADKISSGAEQIIQNAIQHSTHKICVVSFFKKLDELKIIISDLGEKTITETFAQNLDSEKEFLTKNLHESKLFASLSKNIMFYKRSDLEEKKDKLTLNCFFNDFKKDENNKELILEDWFNFRQSDSSAHIGMALFANAVKRCNGKFTLISCKSYTASLENRKYFYSTDESNSMGEVAHYPGTEYVITLPTKKENINHISGIVQFNNTNYLENYSSFAEFIDYKIENSVYVLDREKNTLNQMYNRAKKLGIETAINKYVLQILWTNYWLDIFEHLELGKNKIHYIDYRQVGTKPDFLEHSYAKETVIKGLLDALGVFSNKNNDKKLYIVFANTDSVFLNLFKEISFSLALRAFPSNLQLFIFDKNEDKQIHLVGHNYGEAIQNAYLLSLENYYKSYDGSMYYDVDYIVEPFYKIIEKQNENDKKNDLDNKNEGVKIVPFSGILKSSYGEMNMFFYKLNFIADRDIITENGYKLNHNHTRLGNKVHIDSFYEMSHLFHRTIVANHVAFSIIRELKNKNQLNILEDQILFYGYASYSQAILMSLIKILESYRALHKQANPESKISYSIYQYNLQFEANPKDIKLYLSNSDLSKSKDTIHVIQIVPISSTLTTFAKMWKKLKQENNFGEKLSLNDNFTVFWVRDKTDSLRAKDENGKTLNVSELEYKYFNIDDNGKIISHLSALGEKNVINRILTGETKWEKPEICSQCFPTTDLLEEMPIIETDPTSTVPSQQIYSNSAHKHNQKTILIPLDKNNSEKYSKLYGNTFYGHYKRGKNHYQYFIDTQTYFAAVSSEVKNWLEALRANDKKYSAPIPTIDIIFSPSHNTNVGFSQYVNAYYFNGSAEVISINEDKEFNSNFNCEYAMLKNTIQRLVDDYSTAVGTNGGKSYNCGYKPVRFIFVDDNIITGDSFRKASKLLQSLLPEEIIRNYGTNVFEKCFVLIDRMSHTSRESYILPKENYYAFCEINVSSMRKQGDSCVCCKLKKHMNSLHNRSSTRYSCDYWNAKKTILQEKPFEAIQKDDIDLQKKAYLRMMFSHIIKNFMRDDINNNYVIFDKLLLLFDYFTEKVYEKCYNDELLKYLDSYMDVLKEPYPKNSESIFKKDSVVNMIKIISRPFFTYNQNIKQEILHFLIILCETMISSAGDSQNSNASYQKAAVVSENIIKMFEEPLDLLDFLQNVVLDALTDLHSTYLLRAATIRKILLHINSIYSANCENHEIAEKIKAFFLHYSVCVHRLVDESSDETRSLRMEYFLISAEDNFSENYTPNNASIELTFYEKFLQKEKLEKLAKPVKKFFEYFCNEVFLGNGRILYDGIEKLHSENKDICKSLEETNADEMSSDDYFVERWKAFRKLDNTWGKIENSADTQEQLRAELELYNLLNNEVDLSNDDRSSIIEKRYCEFVTRIRDVITKKYGIERENIHIALLTSSKRKDGKNEIGIQNLELVKNLIQYADNVSSEDKESLDSNTKFIIKKRLVSMLKDTDFNELGYKIVNFDGSQEANTFRQPNINQNYESINYTNYGKPYFILEFQNNAAVNGSDSSKAIIPVYLYLSVLVDKDSHIEKNILPQLIMRDILTYRNKIIGYLEEDFTNDVMERYSKSVATETILKNERVMSHTPMEQDKKELEVLLSEPSENYTETEITLIKGWSIARNYCNTMIARLYNRVFRNIDKSFQKIISEYKYINRETYKLYIQSNGSDNDGKNIPLTNLNQIIPCNNDGENDVIYRLFNDVIDFKYDSARNNLSAYCYTLGDNDYAYNLDYVKSIIYRICFDAMRFSSGSGAEKDDFVSRVANHYRAKERVEMKKKYPNNKWLLGDMPNICNIEFDFEISDSKKFDWLVIKNEINKPFENKIEFLKKKMEDPLDFTDGHMSLITAKEYFAKMLDEQEQNLLGNMYNYIEQNNTTYFITKLPIIKKGEITNENNLDR